MVGEYMREYVFRLDILVSIISHIYIYIYDTIRCNINRHLHMYVLYCLLDDKSYMNRQYRQ